jgi:hypothetical protein
MIGMSIAIIVAVSSSPELNAVPTGLAMQTLRRLAAAIPEEKPNATPTEQAMHKAQKNEVEDLVVYLHKVQEVMSIGNWQPAFYQNYLTVLQQITAAGVSAALLPEEALTWHRAGLDLAQEQLRWMTWQFQAGKQPEQNLYQAKAQYERFRSQYRKALAELVRIVP